MERCYVCNHCGKCDEMEWGIAPPPPVCLDCGHVVEPGESPARCAVCGSGLIVATDRTASPGPGGAQPSVGPRNQGNRFANGRSATERREHE